MVDKELVEKKLKQIENLLKEINSVQIRSLKEFKEDILKKRFIERNIELAIEQMINICKHIVSALDLREPQTYAECIDILHQAGIISKKVETYKSMIRFRNLLIHGYDDIDDSITYGIYRKKLKDFVEFVNEIKKFLKTI